MPLYQHFIGASFLYNLIKMRRQSLDEYKGKTDDKIVNALNQL